MRYLRDKHFFVPVNILRRDRLEDVKKTLRSLLVVIALASVALAVAQQVKLSEPFSKASLAALKAINAGSWEFPSSVETLQAQQADVKVKMAACHDAAQSEDDADAFIFLQRYQLKHSQNFNDYTRAISEAASKRTGKDTLPRAIAQVSANPRFVARKKQELACSAALEKALQSRLFAPPAACDLY
ncbi:MAG: hypothetical protein LAO20_06385 [Acidobacteriia bacterium]|nr:hypothetical protein [Terriglobia bacterium]